MYSPFHIKSYINDNVLRAFPYKEEVTGSNPVTLTLFLIHQ